MRTAALDYIAALAVLYVLLLAFGAWATWRAAR